MKRRESLRWMASGLAAAVFNARAQSNDTPIRLVVPTPPGGASDLSARATVKVWQRTGGVPFVVENRPGAGGAVAAQAVLAAPADGRTLLWTLSSMTGLPMLQRSAPYRALTDFSPIGLVGHFTYGLYVSPELPVKTVAELVAHLRAQPGKLNCAHGPLGEYMAAVQFASATGTRFEHVPYKGGVQIMPDLIAGRVQFNFGPLAGALTHVKAGKLRLLAVLGPQRLTIVNDVPTLAEAGVNTGPLPSWQAIMAPPKTGTEIVERLSTGLVAALREVPLREQLGQLALNADPSSAAGLAELIAQDTEVWRRFIRDQNIPTEG